jgi:hypothetical protein
MENNKKWFLTEKNEIRYLHTVIIAKKEDDETLAVTMENPYNCPDTRNTRIEWVNEHDFFDSLKDCQFEIIRRERFEPKG